jgi:hypothetical protein
VGSFFTTLLNFKPSASDQSAEGIRSRSSSRADGRDRSTSFTAAA